MVSTTSFRPATTPQGGATAADHRLVDAAVLRLRPAALPASDPPEWAAGWSTIYPPSDRRAAAVAIEWVGYRPAITPTNK